MDVYTTWWFLSAFVFILEAYRDLTTQKIDARHIYLVFGYTLFLGVEKGAGLLEIIGFSLAAGVVSLASRGVLARGDQLVLYALFFGHFVSGTLLWFVLCFVASLSAFVIMRRVRGRKDKSPALPLIAGAHVLTLPFFL